MFQYPEFTLIWREVAGRISKWETINLGAAFCTTQTLAEDQPFSKVTAELEEQTRALGLGNSWPSREDWPQ